MDSQTVGEGGVESGQEPAVAEVEALFRAVLGPRWGMRWGARKGLAPFAQELTMAQLRCIMVLAQEEPLAVGVLGERLGVVVPTASRLVEHLVRDGLAERSDDPTDRRRALVKLSPRGHDMVGQMQQGRQARRDRLRRLLLKLPDDKLAQLREAMTALAAIARDEESAEPDPADSGQPLPGAG